MSIIDDVAVLLGRDLTGDEAERAGRLIEIAESAVESALPGFSFAAGSETAGILWHDPNVMWTPRYPVTAINELVVNDSPVDPAWFRFDDRGRIELFDVDPSWVVNRPVLTGWATVTVDYDFGLDPPPPLLAGVVAQMVATVLRRQDANPANVQAETIGNYSVTYGTADQAAAALGMTVPVLPRRWRRTAMVSTPLVRYR